MPEPAPVKTVFGPWTQWVNRNIDRWIAVTKLVSVVGAVVTAMLWSLGLVRFRLILFFGLLYILQAIVTGLLFGLAMGIDGKRGWNPDGSRRPN